MLSPQPEVAFSRLKKSFVSALILCLLEQTSHFIVEVDASNTRLRAVLVQHSGMDNKIRPCAYLLRKLSTTERNYSIGVREVLAVKARWRSGDIRSELFQVQLQSLLPIRF